jgi:hypothetical protein
VTRRLVVALVGLALFLSGVAAFLLSRHVHQGCVAPPGSQTSVDPTWRIASGNCTTAEWAYGLGIAAILCGAVTYLLASFVTIRDLIAPARQPVR